MAVKTPVRFSSGRSIGAARADSPSQPGLGVGAICFCRRRCNADDFRRFGNCATMDVPQFNELGFSWRLLTETIQCLVNSHDFKRVKVANGGQLVDNCVVPNQAAAGLAAALVASFLHKNSPHGFGGGCE